jgi:predicted Fe-Mo cluster-binding NifX family protein
MKIAISATGNTLDARMDSRFGRCPYFIIADAEGSIHDTVENIHAERGSGAGIQAACLLIERGVSIVLTGRCGPNAWETLAAAGVDIVTGCSGTARQAVDRFVADGGAAPGAKVPAGPGSGPSRQGGKGLGRGGGRGRGRDMAKTPRT